MIDRRLTLGAIMATSLLVCILLLSTAPGADATLPAVNGKAPLATPTPPPHLTVSPPSATTQAGGSAAAILTWADARPVMLQSQPQAQPIVVVINPPFAKNSSSNMQIQVGPTVPPGVYPIVVEAHDASFPTTVFETVTFYLTVAASFDSGPEQSPKLNTDYGDTVCMSADTVEECPIDDMFGIIDPVALHNGEFTLDELDLKIPGRGFDYELRRTYKNQIHYRGPLGANWQHNYDQFLLQSSSSITLVNGAARADLYTSTNSITFTSPAGFYNSLLRNLDGSYTLRNPHGASANFAALDNSAGQGKLTQLADRNGNRMTFAYDGLGRLVRAVDTLSRPITYTYNISGLLDYVQDFSGRRVTYGYANGDLVTATLPAVTGTPNGNDFPNGKTWRYTYSAGFGDERLNHNLLTVIAPNEVAAGSFTPRVSNSYGTAGYDLDRLTVQTWGGTNAGGVPAGGVITLTYTQLNPAGDPNDLSLPRNRTTLIDRNGNQKVYEHNVNGQRLSLAEFSNRDVRPTDPVSWTAAYAYNRDGERTLIALPLGNVLTRTFNSGAANRLQQGNRLAMQHTRDARGGDQSAIATTRSYEPIYNELRSLTEPRGNDPAYTPQNGGAWSAARYTTRYTFDYEEACDFAALGAKTGRSAAEAQQLLTASGMCASPLGDVNGDGLTNQSNGNVIRIQHPGVTLAVGSNEALAEGTTTQPIVELYWYNQFGQKVRAQDPEANVTFYEYYTEQDPNGDGVIDFPGGNATTGGYLNLVTRDAVAAAGRDTGTNPTPVNARAQYRYDALGNLVRRIDGRGIATDYTVNQLNQVVQVTRAAAHDLFSPSPSEPASLTDFLYLERIYYDYNDNIVVQQTEDRGNTSGVDGNPPGGDLPSIVPNPDPSGGAAFVDTIYKYDILDRRIEMVEEVANGGNPEFLHTRYRYDPNGNRVLVIQPAGNAVASSYDERDLLFQTIHGAVGPPPLVLLAGSDPTAYDVRGGLPATTTSHYDRNRNLIETVDAADSDGASANNSDLGGAGDRTRYLYDGFDRRTSLVDSAGNQTVYQYDPAGNVVRVARFGPVGGASPTSDGPDTLLVPVSTNGTIQSANLVNPNLLEATAYLYDELSRRIQVDRALFVNTTGTARTVDAADGASDIGGGDLTPGDTCAVPGAVAPPSGFLGCVSTRAEFDRNSRQTFAVTDAANAARTFYDGADRVIKVVDAEGNIAETAYDDDDNVIETRATDVSQKPGIANELFLTTYFYDSLNRPVRQVDNLGQTLDYRYDSRGNRVAMADSQGPPGPAISRRGFAAGARTVNTTNLFGNITQYFYDGLNRLVREDHILTASGQGDGANIGATLEGVKTTTPTPDTAQGGGDGRIRLGSSYDANSLPSAALDDQGNATIYVYDNLDRRVAEARGLTVNTTPLNKTKILGARQIVAPTVATVNSPAVVPAASIDTQLAAAKTRLNAVAGLFPPLANRVDDNPPTTIVYGYDPDGDLLILEDENDSETFYKYDALHRTLALRVFRSGQGDSHSGDPLFAPAPVADPSNPSGSFPAVAGTTKQDYQYDGLSRLVRATDNNDPVDPNDETTLWFAYDSLSRVVEESEQLGIRPVRATSTTWRAHELGARTTYPNGRDVLRRFDHLDRLQTIADTPYQLYLPAILRDATGLSAGGVPPGSNRLVAAALTPTVPIATYSYIGERRMLERAYGNGVRATHLDDAGTTDVGYDGMGRETQLRHMQAGITLTVGFMQTYDRANNRLNEAKLHNAANNERYTYDSADRLVRFERPNGGALAPLQSQWTLDGAGNWQQVDGEARRHSSHNEIISRTNTLVLSDDGGNETDDGTLLYRWDALNRLRSVTRKSDSALLAVYTYDALGRRVRKVVTNSGALDGTTDFYYDGWRVIEERNAADALTQQYVWGRYLDELLTINRNQDGNNSATSQADRRLFAQQNAVYSIYALTDGGGKVVEGYQYDAYGRVTVFTPGANGMVDFGGDDGVAAGGSSAVGNPYQFSGQRLDPESGLLEYKWRYLAPVQGRFISRDPIRAGFNLYQYVDSRPTVFVDPLGLIGYSMQDPKKVPWSEADLKKGVAGLTVPTKLEVHCGCECCAPKLYRVECTVTLEFQILIDPKHIPKGTTTNGVYGHEQMHVTSMQKAVKDAVDKAFKDRGYGECVWPKKTCENKAKEAEERLLEAAQAGLVAGAGHDAPGKPHDHEPHDPLPGTDVPGLKNKWKVPKTIPPGLEDFWKESIIPNLTRPK